MTVDALPPNRPEAAQTSTSSASEKIPTALPPSAPPPPSCADQASFSDFTFDTLLSVPRESGMEWILGKEIPELRWNDEAENWGKIRIMGIPPGPAPRVSVAIARKEPPGPFNLRIVVRGALEPAAEAFRKAITQRITMALYAVATDVASVTSKPSSLTIHFTPPFFSLRADVPVAEEFEMDNMSGFVARLRDHIPELSWVGMAEEVGWEMRIAAQGHSLANNSSGHLPAGNTIQPTCLSLFRCGPFNPFDLWIHIAAPSEDEADRGLHLLEHQIRLALRSRYARPYVPLPGSSMTRVLPSEYPPIFHLDFRMEAPPPGLPPDLEFRLNDGTPGAPWKAIVRDGKRIGVYLEREDSHGFELTYILAQPEPDRIRVIIDLTAESRERLEIFREHFIRKIQVVLLNPVRRP